MSAGRAEAGSPAPVREAERRADPRLPLRLPLGYREVMARPPVLRRCQTVDVSRGGVRFRSDAMVPRGSFLVVELELPRRGTHASRVRTVWVREAAGGGHWEVGTEFVRRGGDADAELAEVLVCGGGGTA